MDLQLLDYIQRLSREDRKTLSQKALKTTEEVGEMAKKVLPFDNAFATTHRYVERRGILEESVDTVLCSLSVAYDLGFSHEEIIEMMYFKANKWFGLQAKESKVTYPVPFELHVTVESAPSAVDFKTACQEIGVKPIFLALQNPTGTTVLHDVMTSSVVIGDNRKASEELERVSTALADKGYKVVRRKIETVPWHPAAPQESAGAPAMPPGCYFESHVGVLLEAADMMSYESLRNKLGAVVTLHKAHLSRNAFKQHSDLAVTVMVTLRSYEQTREAFEAARDQLLEALKAEGFATEKVITEFSLFDSRVHHDSAWLTA